MRLFLRILCVTFLGCFSLSKSIAQTCPTGYTANATLNWDLMKFLKAETAVPYFVTPAMETNQNFAFGKGSMNLTFTGVTAVGESVKQTGKTGSFAEGADIEFSGNGAITLSFPSPVYNLKFSIQDVERGQRIDLSASNAGVAQNIILATCATTGSVLTINSNSSINPFVTSSNGTGQTGAAPNTSNVGSFNVTIAGPVTSVIISSSNNTVDTDFFLSDIQACVNGVFASSYYEVSRPFTNQPGRVLVAINSSVYSVETSTGKAKLIFSDGATSGTINSLAYDPHNKIIYYCWSLTNNGSASASEKTLRKYDFASGSSTTVVNDITSLGIPTYYQGVESGAAAFFDGALYIGIEGGSTSNDVKTSGNPNKTTTGKKSIIWRLDFNSSLVPIRASQVYAVDGDKHDWSDFSISNAVLHDFNGDADLPDYHSINLVTGIKQRFTNSTIAPKQSAVGWDGTVYWVSDQIGQYNLSGGVGTRFNITSTPTIPNWSNSTAPSFGDAAEAFRPRADFGDAPASYDPDQLSPALHEEDPNLRLGSNMNVEWNKVSVTNSDIYDDGLAFTTIMNTGLGSYMTEVDVYNNTGRNATVCAWIDFNKDGAFQSAEGISYSVPTSTTMRRVALYWPVIPSLPQNTDTYLRIRITSESVTTPMTVANSTGYFVNGEVEDYRVLVNTSVLSANLKDFSVVKVNDSEAKVAWVTTGETANIVYELQRSIDGINWSTIYIKHGTGSADNTTYTYIDAAPVPTKNYYRLKYSEIGKTEKFSAIQQLLFQSNTSFKVYPNPAFEQLVISLNANKTEPATIRIMDVAGKTVFSRIVQLQKGSNNIEQSLQQLTPGVYYVQVQQYYNQLSQKILIQKN